MLDDLKFKIYKVTLVLNMLKEELANLETKMEVLGDLQATVEQNLEDLIV